MKKFLILFLIILFSVTLNTSSVAASNGSNKSWVNSGNSGIYNGGSSSLERITWSDEPESNIAEKLISAMIANAADNIGKALYAMNMDLDSIIYGRVMGKGNDSANYLRFEIREGNVYGTVGAICYNVIRSIVWVLSICVLGTLLVKSMYGSGKQRAREELKTGISNFAIVILLLYLMPNIVDLLIYVRDCVVYAISWVASDALGIEGRPTLIRMMRRVYEDKVNVVAALVYFGMVCVALYYIISYISIALSFTIHFCLFPIISVTALFDRRQLTEWFKETISSLLVPIIDVMLFFIIIVMVMFMGRSRNFSDISDLFSALTGTPHAISLVEGFIIVVACGMVIPARNLIRSKLGLGRNQLDGIGMMSSFMAIRTAIGAVKMAATAALVVAGGMAAGAGAASAGAMEGSLAGAEGGASATAGASAGASSSGSEMSAMGNASKAGGSGFDSGFGNIINSAEKTGGSSEGSKATTSDNVNTSEASQNSTTSGIGQGGGNRVVSMSQLRERKEALNTGINSKSARIGELRKNTGDLMMKKANGEAFPGMSDQIEKNKAQIETLNGEIALDRAEISSIDNDMAMEDMRIRERYANVNNFQRPEFSNISHKRKAELYKELSAREYRRAVGTAVVGGVGAVGGATLGLGATMFGTTTAKAMGVSGGAALGGKLGSLAYNGYDSLAYPTTNNMPTNATYGNANTTETVSNVNGGGSVNVNNSTNYRVSTVGTANVNRVNDVEIVNDMSSSQQEETKNIIPLTPSFSVSKEELDVANVLYKQEAIKYKDNIIPPSKIDSLSEDMANRFADAYKDEKGIELYRDQFVGAKRYYRDYINKMNDDIKNGTKG